MSRRLVVLSYCVSAALLGAAHGARAETLSLDDALSRTLVSNPALMAARTRVESAKADLVGAKLASQYNPELSIVSGTRNDDHSPVDLGVELWQELEVSGQRRHRRAAALAELASEESWQRHRQAIALTATQMTFNEVLAAEERVRLAGEAVALSFRLDQTAKERYEAGATTVLERNLARVRLGESRRAALAAQRRAAEALASLKDQLAWPLDEELLIVGELEAGQSSSLDIESLRARLGERRADLIALALAQDAATARSLLARSLGRPNLNFGIGWEREEGDEDVSLGVSIALPFFNRQQADRAIARSGLTRSKVDQAGAQLKTQRALDLAWERYTIALEDHAVFDEDVLSQAEENLELLQLSFEAGKVSLLQLLPLQQELVELREAHVDALVELAMARTTLEFTAGLNTPPVSSTRHDHQEVTR